MVDIKIAQTTDVSQGQGKVIELNDRVVALFNVNGKFYVIDNTCLHREGPLGDGSLDDNIVTCPWHGWKYDITTGQNMAPGPGKVRAYKVTVKGNEIFITL